MAINAIVTQLMGNGEFLKAFAGNVGRVHNSEFVAHLYQHPGNTGSAVGLALHENAFAGCYVRGIDTQPFDFHFAQNQTGGPFRQRFPRKVGVCRSLVLLILSVTLQQHLHKLLGELQVFSTELVLISMQSASRT